MIYDYMCCNAQLSVLGLINVLLVATDGAFYRYTDVIHSILRFGHNKQLLKNKYLIDYGVL